MNALRYQLEFSDLNGHYIDVSLRFIAQKSQLVLLKMPAWIPGSYMIRDFARHIVDLSVAQQNSPVVITQVDKQSWQFIACGGEVTVHYRVYAFDLSVRANYVSSDIAVVNPAACCLSVANMTELPHLLSVEAPTANPTWQIACALPRADSLPVLSFGTFAARNYAELIDSPLLAGVLTVRQFSIDEVPHYLVLCNELYTDPERIVADLAQLCQAQRDVFGELPANLTSFWFLTWLVDQGYGGLEHRASTLLLANRFSLPNPQQPTVFSSDYQNFLALCSHEYFHLWWVKRARPKSYLDYQLAAEQYSGQLWLYEGFTSYYDDLSLLRTGKMALDEYLTLMAKSMSRLKKSPANTRQSLRDSSFNAWTRFYRQDENAVNTITSYYSKGALLAFCLDAFLQEKGLNLDEFMQRCWQEFGRDELGSTDEAFFDLLATYSNDPQLSSRCRHWVDDANELPLEQACQLLGIELQWRPAKDDTDFHQGTSGDEQGKDLGFTFDVKPDGLWVKQVRNASLAHQSGLSAGDVVIAINQLRATESNYREVLSRLTIGNAAVLTLFRGQKLLEVSLPLIAPPATVAALRATEQLTAWPGFRWPLDEKTSA